ncbi:MAG: tyrosine-type recombinase/integrase, partial [Actinomycetota bacterium]
SRARDESYLRNHVLPVFGRRPLSSISQLDVRQWVAELDAKGLKPATVHKAYQILGKIMSAAVDAEIISKSPCRKVQLPKVDAQEMRFLAPDEVWGLAEAIDPRYRAFVLLAAYSGLRRGEIFGLRPERLDLLRGRVEVAEILVEVRGHQTFGPPKTRAGLRWVPLPRPVCDELGRHLAAYPGDLVFTSPQGSPMRGSQFRARYWLPAVKRAGLEPLRLHDLRHTAVALWIAAGASVKEIQKRAGHASSSTIIDRYGHVLPSAEEKVNQGLEELFWSGQNLPQEAPIFSISKS